MGGPHCSGQRLIPHVGQIRQQLAQQSIADLAANAQLLCRVNAILIGDDCLCQDLGSLHQSINQLINHPTNHVACQPALITWGALVDDMTPNKQPGPWQSACQSAYSTPHMCMQGQGHSHMLCTNKGRMPTRLPPAARSELLTDCLACSGSRTTASRHLLVPTQQEFQAV